MKHNSNLDWIKLVVISAGFGANFLKTSYDRFVQCRKIQDMGSIPIGSAPQGLVELQGYAWPMKKAEYPIEDKQKTCVYYSVKIQQSRRQGNSTRWVDLFAEDCENPFFVADETGHVIVMPNAANIEHIKCKKESWWKLPEARRAEIELYVLNKTGSPLNPGTDAPLLRPDVKIEEVFVLAGAPIFLYGNMRPVEAGAQQPSRGLKSFINKINILKRGSILGAQQILDLDRDGRVSFEEWYQGAVKIAHEASAGFDENQPLILQKGMEKNSQCFGLMQSTAMQKLILADCHEEELLQRINRFNVLRLIAGAILVAFACGVLVQQVSNILRGIMPASF